MNLPKRWVELDGRRASYREAGRGPAVIIAPGLGLSPRFYQPVLSRLGEAGFRAIAPELPGFGQARGAFTGSSIEQGAAWLLRFADAVDAREPVWIGHSISCQIVLAVAELAPERVRALILAAPTGAPGRRKLHQARTLARVAVTEAPRVILAVARDYIRANPVQYLGAWIRAARDSPLDRAPRIHSPTLILVGERDPVPPRDFVDELGRRLPHAVVVYVPNGNHALPLDQPETFSRHAMLFLDATLRDQPPR